jgi:sugar O-acyltransferase (sialic acid O-acetyltransferase NeuD family)
MSKKSKKLFILGAGGHGKVCADCAESMKIYSKIVFLDDNHAGTEVIGHEVIGGFSELNKVVDECDEFFVAIGSNKERMALLEQIENIKAATLIHPQSIVSNHVTIGPGTIVAAGAIVNTDVTIKKGVIVNTRAVIEHDCILEDGVHVSPGAVIAGGSLIGKNTWVCIGAKVSNGIRIGSNSIVAADSTVLKDVQDNVMVAGTPAEIKKELQ